MSLGCHALLTSAVILFQKDIETELLTLTTFVGGVSILKLKNPILNQPPEVFEGEVLLPKLVFLRCQDREFYTHTATIQTLFHYSVTLLI